MASCLYPTENLLPVATTHRSAHMGLIRCVRELRAKQHIRKYESNPANIGQRHMDALFALKEVQQQHNPLVPVHFVKNGLQL